MKKRVLLQTAVLLAATLNLSEVAASCFPPAKSQTPLDVLECLQSKLDSQQKRIAKLEKENKRLRRKMNAISVSMKFTGDNGPMCVFAKACPNGWVDKGAGGYIRSNGGECPYKPGAAFNHGWTWCHPRICCNQ